VTDRKSVMILSIITLQMFHEIIRNHKDLIQNDNQMGKKTDY